MNRNKIIKGRVTRKSTSDDIKKSLAVYNVTGFEPDNRVIIGGEMCPPVKVLYRRQPAYLIHILST